MGKYFLYTRSIFISDLLRSWGSDVTVITRCAPLCACCLGLLDLWHRLLALLAVPRDGSVLCFYLKLQQGDLSRFRFHFPPLDPNGNFKLVTCVVSTFRLHVKRTSKFARLMSEANLVQNLNLFILTKQTVNCFSLGLMKAPLRIDLLIECSPPPRSICLRTSHEWQEVL